MIRRPPRSTLDRSSAASDVYKRQIPTDEATQLHVQNGEVYAAVLTFTVTTIPPVPEAVSYTHLRAHETVLDLVCRLLLETTPLMASSQELYIQHTSVPAITVKQIYPSYRATPKNINNPM